MNPKDYLGIRAWGLFLGSSEHYITHTQELAAKQNAPEDSVYNVGHNRWVTLDELKTRNVRQHILSRIEELRARKENNVIK